MPELNSNTEWKLWGIDDPLWAVSSCPHKQKDGASPWTEEEFYALGASDWQDFLGHWQHYGLSRETCLEIGCGAGRITRQLAQSFDRVNAVDVSESMISFARRGVASSNVEFSLIDGITLPQGNSSVKAIFSTHVLQHLDTVDIGFSYFREFFRVLDEGGTMMVHLPLYEFPFDAGRITNLLRNLYGFHRRLTLFRANTKRRKAIRIMRGTPYPIGELTALLSDLGFRNVEYRLFRTKSTGFLHSFVFATK